MKSSRKYELRSSEVQEVIRTPANRILLWANVVIIIAFISGLYLFSLIPIQQIESYKVKIIKANETCVKTSAMYLLQFVEDQTTTATYNQEIQICYLTEKKDLSLILESQIDSIYYCEEKQFIKLKVKSNMTIQTLLNKNCVAKISSNSINLLELLKKNIFSISNKNHE